MSEALVWQVIRKNNSRALRRSHPSSRTTLEKGSLKNQRKKHDSGLCGRFAVDVTPNDEGIPVLYVRTNKEENARKPDRLWQQYTLNGGVRKALKRAESVLAAHPESVKKAALRKISASYRAVGRIQAGWDHTRLIAQ